MRHTFQKAVVISLLAASCMTGCGQKQQPHHDPDTKSEGTTSPAEFPDNADEIVSSAPSKSEPPFLTPDSNSPLHDDVRAEWGNEKAADGGLICFTEPTDGTGTPVRSNSIPMKDGTIEMDIDLITYSSKRSDFNVTGTLIFFWNGEPYDFSVDGKKSTNGVLKVDMKYFEDIIAPFKAENLPVKKGKNTFHCCFIPYCADKNIYPTPQIFTAFYSSDEERDGISPCEMTNEKDIDPERIAIVTDEADSKIVQKFSKSSLVDRKITDYCDILYLRHDPTFFVNALNNEKGADPSDRSGILMFFVDGELQPVWNENIFAYAEISDTEYIKSFAVDTDFQVGEEHDVLMAYAELEDDKNSGDPTIRSASFLCRITE